MRTIRPLRLNFRHLHYFWAVAREGHLTRVAEHLHVSQSALSSQIRQLEQQIGHDLFVREGRTLRLTEVGQVVLGYADSIFALGNQLVTAVAAGEGQQRQHVRIGSVATLSRNFQENFLRPVMGNKDILLMLESGSLPELLNRLAVYKLDLVLSNRPVSAEADRPWRCRLLAHQPVCLVGPPRQQDQPFDFQQELAGLELLLPGPTSDIRTQFDLVCERLNIRVNVHAEVDDMAMLRLLARDSGRVALLPAVVVQDELRNGLLQQYCEVPDVYENFYAISTERQFQPAVLKTLLQDGGDTA